MQQLRLTVRQLNAYVRSLLEGDSHLSAFTLEGELSNFKNHYASGHWYFVLKDADAAVRSVMFKGNAARVDFLPVDGMRVICRGYVSFYEKDGQFQFYAETMRPFGQGDLAAAFERVKASLQEEGLFAPERKRTLPTFPKKIGIVTSETGAALQDMLQILSRRYPLCNVALFPALVQGITAPQSLCCALETAYKMTDLDLLIIGRGGGSAEDLSAFNDETLARTVARSPIPVISAVGHEVDYTICDFVSDLRAPTPSAAAEIATPDIAELNMRLEQFVLRSKTALQKLLELQERRLKDCLSRRPFAHCEMLFSPFEMRLDGVTERLMMAYLTKLHQNETALSKVVNRLIVLSPQQVLARGFALVSRDGEVIKKMEQLEKNDRLLLQFADGTVSCLVEEI